MQYLQENDLKEFRALLIETPDLLQVAPILQKSLSQIKFVLLWPNAEIVFTVVQISLQVQLCNYLHSSRIATEKAKKKSSI